MMELIIRVMKKLEEKLVLTVSVYLKLYDMAEITRVLTRYCCHRTKLTCSTFLDDLPEKNIDSETFQIKAYE